MPRILSVDDDPAVLRVISKTLARNGYDVLTETSAPRALALVQSGIAFDLIICDHHMPELSGLEFLEQLQNLGYTVPLIMVTGHASIDHAVTSLKAGAVDYIVKPFLPAQLEIVVEHALDVTRLRQENEELRHQVRSLTGSGRIVGESPAILAVVERLQAVAQTRATVLIEGESGTGKEVLARALHDMSGRTGVFVSINCAAMPDTLVESILFGHEKGAFTGAVKQVKGAFERADRGTLLLDEISEMRLDLQAKLLRVLQEHEFERVGGTAPIRIDARVVATTNRDLLAEVGAGRFREDLYYRLAVVPVHVPPLRERPEDIPRLAAHFAAQSARQLERDFQGISPAALQLLRQYSWPGNVRELAHAVERALILARSPVLTPDAFDVPSSRATLSGTPATAPADDTSQLPALCLTSLRLDEAERVLIERALQETGHNRTRAAELLGISIRTLRNKLNRPQD